MSTGTWPQAYYDWASGVIVADSGTRCSIAPRAPVADLLNALPSDVRRVYLCGTLPDHGLEYPGMCAIDPTLLWGATLPTSSGWAENPDRRHFRTEEGDPGSLFLRYRRLATTGRTVEVGCLARWVGDALARSASPDDARWLFAWLANALNEAFVVHSNTCWHRPPVLYGTPSLTGRALLEVTLQNAHREVPLLSDAEQAFIRSILPQPRVERFAAPVVGATLQPGASYMDGRLMYAASMTGLGTGPLTRDDTPDFEPYRPGFYHVRFRVPAGWDLPGILPVKNGAGSWRWPSHPGEQANTWAGDMEVAAALWPQPHVCPDCAAGRTGKRGSVACNTHGWHVQVLERALLVKPSSGPLDLWAGKLTELYLTAKTCAASDGRYELAATAIRSLLLNTFGSFNARAETRRLTRISTSGDAVPPGVRAIVMPAADGGLVYRWNELVPPDPEEEAREAREARWRHPEFCAQVWSRCRGRLLLANVVMGEQRVMTGLLALPPHSVVAVQTDALLLTHNPHWPDDGRPGRLRAKRVLRETATWPAEWDDLEAVKARMEVTV